MRLRRFTDTGEWTTRRYLSLLANVLIWIIVAIDAWYLWPTQLQGSTSMVIVSGRSMEPTYFTGDLVIARKITPDVGDAIVYAPEGFGGLQIVHRIIGGNATDGWQMQGDNNDFVDPFTPKGNEVKGVVLVHYANFGRVTVLLLNPIVWALVLLVAIVLLVWWSGDKCEDDPEDPNGDSTADRDPEPRDAAADEVPLSGQSPGDSLDDVNRPAADAESPFVNAAVAASKNSVERQRVTSKRAAVAALTGLLALVLTASPASAATLQVNGRGNVAIIKSASCASQTLAATVSGTASSGSYTSMSLSGIATACQGQPTTVTLYSAAGIALATGTATPAAATATFATRTYVAANVKNVLVTVNGWPFVVPWTAPATGPYTCIELTAWPSGSGNAPSTYGTPTGNTCTITYTYLDAWGGTPPKHFNLYFTVSGAATGNWRVTINFADPYFQGWVPDNLSGNGNPLPAPGYACSQLPTFVGQANLIWAAGDRNTGYLAGSSVGNSGSIC